MSSLSSPPASLSPSPPSSPGAVFFMCLCKNGIRGPWLLLLLDEAPEAARSLCLAALAAALGATFAAGGTGAFFFFAC